MANKDRASKAAQRAVDETNKKGGLRWQQEDRIDAAAKKAREALDRAAEKAALPDLKGKKLYGKDD